MCLSCLISNSPPLKPIVQGLWFCCAFWGVWQKLCLRMSLLNYSTIIPLGWKDWRNLLLQQDNHTMFSYLRRRRDFFFILRSLCIYFITYGFWSCLLSLIEEKQNTQAIWQKRGGMSHCCKPRYSQCERHVYAVLTVGKHPSINKLATFSMRKRTRLNDTMCAHTTPPLLGMAKSPRSFWHV